MATRDSKDKDGVKKDDRAGGGARAGFDGYMTEDQCRAELEQKIEETRRLEESRRRKKEEEDRKMEEQRKRDDEHRRTDRSRDDDHRRKRSKSPVRSRSNSQRRSRDREAHGRSRSPISRARSPRRGKSRSPKRTDSPRRSRSPRRRSRTPPRREQRSPSASRLTEFEILKSNHPKFVNSRVFIGRLDQERIMREDLVELFGRYGRLLGVSIFKGFGFVQFGNEQDANAAIAAENHSLLKGCNLDLRIASEGRKKVRVPIPGDDPKSWDPKYRREYGARGQEPPLPPRMPPAPPPSMVAQVDRPPIECQFALHTNESTVREYADQIDTRLAPIGIRSHKLEFESDADLRGILEKAARHKVPYAIVLRSQNQVHSSLTLNVLYGTAQEHRNMPLEDALSFIKKNFELYIQELREKSRSHPAPQPVLRVPPPPPRPLAGPPPPMAAPTPEYLPPPRHVHYLLNLIADSRILTLEEVDSLLDYLEAQRRLIVKYRGGPPRRAPPETNDRLSKEKDSGAADPPPEIQAKILNILNGGQEGSQQQQPPPQQQQQFHQPTMVEPPSTTQSAANLNLNFQDPSVKQALDNLMQSGPSLLQNIGTAPAAVPQGNGFGQEEKLAQMHQQFQMHQQQVQFQQQQQQQQQMQMQTQQAMQMQGAVPFGGQPPTGYGITPTPSYRF